MIKQATIIICMGKKTLSAMTAPTILTRSDEVGSIINSRQLCIDERFSIAPVMQRRNSLPFRVCWTSLWYHTQGSYSKTGAMSLCQ